ncbi:GNAT family N-acetyltransferase [Natronorubrum sp. DTA28]|uniref:GNAT family N-acetyltransferase n=1 Tax=Natronorubrum sp. DTA28 TaxID=3447019 RepID=UPI003F85653E
MFGRDRMDSLERQYVSGDREYTIRQYREGDRDGLLAVYQEVLDPTLSSDWFAWKYETNPYTEEIPVYVAEFDGDIVGAVGFWVLELHTGSRRIPAVQSCDGAVRAEHRREGLFTELFRIGLDRFAADGFEIVFDFPNQLSKATFEKYGWQLVERQETYFRVQQPDAMVDGESVGPLSALARGGARVLSRGYLAAKSRQRPSVADHPKIDVDRSETIPSQILAALYRHDIPDKLHLVRDETFYEWRFGNPHWEYTTYVGRYDGSPVAAVTTGTKVDDGTTIVHLTDIVPLVSSRPRTAVLVSVLEAILEANEEAALVVAPSGVIPDPVLSAYGFRSDQTVPFSLVSTPTIHGVYALRDDDEADGDRWVVDGKRVTDPDAWQTTFSEYDTG